MKGLLRMCIMAPFQHPYQDSLGTEATTGMFNASATSAGVRKDASRYSAMKADDRPMTEERMKPIIVKSSGLKAGRTGTIAGTAIATSAILRWSKASEERS